MPHSKELVPTITQIKNAVSQSYGIKREALEQSKRGQINEPRNVAIFLSRKHSGLRLEEIGKEFGLGKYSSVSSVVIRIGAQLIRNKQLQKRLKEIRHTLDKSQAKT